LARSKITQILSYMKMPPLNLSSDEMKALKKLRSVNSIRIMKTDKGNVTVIIDRQEYEDN